MEKRKFQYKVGEQIRAEAGDNSRFDLGIADKIARKLFGLWDWRSVIEAVYAPSGLESLSNLWLGNQAPKPAYAVVVNVGYLGYTSKYVAISRSNQEEANL